MSEEFASHQIREREGKWVEFDYSKNLRMKTHRIIFARTSIFCQFDGSFLVTSGLEFMIKGLVYRSSGLQDSCLFQRCLVLMINLF